jgi:hypothetical protein
MHARNELQDVQENTRDDERVRGDGDNLSQLATDLHTYTIHASEAVIRTHTIEVVDPGLAENTSEEGANHATDSVELEDIHALVDLDPLIDILAKRANRSSEKTDEGGYPHRDITCSRSNADKTSDSSRASTDHREVTFGTDVLNRHPAENSEGGRSVGVEGSQHRAHSAVKSTTSVEAEPAKPDEDSADEDECRIMSFSVDLVALVKAFAEDEGVGEGRPAGCNVNGAATCEV